MNFRGIVITGASSGIGAALAQHYAAPGVMLGLTGRNAERLKIIADQARAKGATIEEGLFDLRERTALLDFLTRFDAARPIDLLIANAGILDGRRADGTIEDFETARRVIDVNLLGTLDIVHAVLPAMRRRRQGHIVLVSSLAALSPLPDAPAYSASKAGMLSYGKALRAAVAPDMVRVSVVCPGYVTSGMTATHIGKHPMKISAEKAAGLIGSGIARNRPVIAFPFLLYVGSLLSAFLPEKINALAIKGMRFHVAPHD